MYPRVPGCPVATEVHYPDIWRQRTGMPGSSYAGETHGVRGAGAGN